MAQNAKSPAFRLLISAGRLLVTAGLLALLVVRVDPRQLGTVLAHGALMPFVAAVLVLAAATPVVALRWHSILSGQGSPGWRTLLKILWLGLFFNQVLPSGVGGDAMRAWRCRKLGLGLGVAVRSILLDRACGYAVLVTIYAACLPALLRVVREPLQQRTLVAVLAAAATGLAAMFLLDRLPGRVVRLRAIAPFAELARDARRLVTDPLRIVGLLLLSSIGIGLAIFSIALVAMSVGITIPFGDWLMIVPPVTFIQLLPVSLAGWGVREVALVVILAAFGIPAATALAASLAIGISLLLVALPGGLIWAGNWDQSAGIVPAAAAPDLPQGPRA